MKSPFRWAGSKAKLISRLSSLVPKSYARYIEPFAGSACMFFHLLPKRAILSDVNRELINTYRQIKQHPKAVCNVLNQIPDTSESTYYALRASNPKLLTPYQRAARFIYLNRLCFNGLYRTNAKGHFNVPYGDGHRTGSLPTREGLFLAAGALRKASLHCKSFEYVLRQAKEGDFVYLDPPYHITNRRVFNNYASHVFSNSHLELLRSELVRMHKAGVQFLLTFGLSKEALALAEGFKIHHAMVQRNISGFSLHRKKAREILICNYKN